MPTITASKSRAIADPDVYRQRRADLACQILKNDPSPDPTRGATLRRDVRAVKWGRRLSAAKARKGRAA